MGDGDKVNITECKLRILEHILRHGQERAAVGQRAALRILAEQLPVFHKCRGCGLC